MAAAISFYALFSMFPLGLAIISAAGFLLGPEAEKTRLAQDLATVLPVSNQFVGETMQGLVRARTITGIASFFGLLWASSSAFGAIRKGINAAWGVTRTRPFLRERMIDIGLVLGAGVLVVTILFLSPLLGYFREIVHYLSPESDVAGDFIWLLAPQLATPILTFGTFLILFRYMPNTQVQFTHVWPGALLASVGFYGTQLGFIWYVKTFPIYNVVYGSVGAVMALLTWVYVSAIILLFGALFTSRYAKFAANAREGQKLRAFWTGCTRVRLRTLPVTDAS